MSYLNFYELNFKKFMNHKIKGNWIKNFLLENMYIDFENNNNFSYKFHPDQNYKKYYEETPLETKLSKFCLSVLDKFKTSEQINLLASFLCVSFEQKFFHSNILFIWKNKNIIKLFIYEPNGSVSFYSEKQKNFLNVLKEEFENIVKNDIKYNEEIQIFSIPDMGIQKLSEPKINFGYCLIYSSFFLYCIVMLLENVYKNTNVESAIAFFNDLFFEIEVKNNIKINYYYSILVYFANNLKDYFLNYIHKNHLENTYLPMLNSSIFTMVTLHKKHELTEDILNEEELQIKVFEEYKSLEKRNYKKEFQNLDWSKIKEKMGGEECKIDNDCISKICEKNICTNPNDNDKLDFLNNLEWIEAKNHNIKVEKELEKIKTFFTEKSIENLENLENDTKDFLLLSLEYLLMNDTEKYKNYFTSNFTMHHHDQNCRKIVNYKEKYLFVESLIKGKTIFIFYIGGKEKYLIEEKIKHYMTIFYCKNFFLEISDSLHDVKFLKNLQDCVVKISRCIYEEFYIKKILYIKQENISLKNVIDSIKISVIINLESDIEIVIENNKIILNTGGIIFLHNCDPTFNIKKKTYFLIFECSNF